MSSLAEIHAAEAELKLWHEEANRKGLSPLSFSSANWTYDGDKHVPANRPLKVVAMGVNPGDGNGAIQHGMTKSERTWRTRCARLTNTPPSETVFAELVSIPTKTIGALGDGLGGLDDAIKASAKLNRAIISFHKPNAVYQPGLLGGFAQSVIQHYGLTAMAELKRTKNSNETLLFHYDMKDGTPWISFKHFASFGFSNADRTEIQQYVAALSR